MKVEDYLRAQKIEQEIKRLQNLRDKVSKNGFVISISFDKVENESDTELRESFMPMDEEYNRKFFNNLNLRIQQLNKEFENI